MAPAGKTVRPRLIAEKPPPGEPLGAAFFARDTATVARELLGKSLCRRREDGTVYRLVLTETEAYDGFEDRASHAHKGSTPRNAVMFGPAGVWYVYLCYGVHWLANITCGEVGYPAAVLLRGAGIHDGPGRLTKVLGVGKAEDGRVAGERSGFWIEEPPGEWSLHPRARIRKTPRIGVDYAGPKWAKRHFRFVLV